MRATQGCARRRALPCRRLLLLLHGLGHAMLLLCMWHGRCRAHFTRGVHPDVGLCVMARRGAAPRFACSAPTERGSFLAQVAPSTSLLSLVNELSRRSGRGCVNGARHFAGSVAICARLERCSARSPHIGIRLTRGRSCSNLGGLRAHLDRLPRLHRPGALRASNPAQTRAESASNCVKIAS